MIIISMHAVNSHVDLTTLCWFNMLRYTSITELTGWSK